MPPLRLDIRVDSEQDLTPGVMAGAEAIAALSSNTCPVDTGALKASHSAVEVGRNHAAVLVGVDYASYVEYGTYKMAAQPYLGPAADALMPSILTGLGNLDMAGTDGMPSPADILREMVRLIAQTLADLFGVQWTGPQRGPDGSVRVDITEGE